jgi:hypothetical protein
MARMTDDQPITDPLVAGREALARGSPTSG